MGLCKIKGREYAYFLHKNQLEMMKEKYNLLYVDPPRWYNSRKTGGERNDKTKFGGGAEKHYPLMRDEQLLDMKDFIQQISEDNCIMFMWATMPRLDFAIRLMEQWGFSYKTAAFTRVKINKDGTYRINPGYYTASNIELVLIGIKGKNNGAFKPKKTMLNQIIAEPIREHSRKPDAVIERIETMYPEQKKIELFARQKREGWDAWGNQIDLF